MTVSTVNYNTNQYEYNSANRTQRNILEFEKAGSATKESTSSSKGEAIGLCAVGNQAYIATYAESSTPENPIIKVGDYEVYVNEVDPNNATELEMFALLSYMDDVGLTEQSGMASFSKMRAYASQSEYNGNCEGIYDEEAFWSKKQNWSQILNDAKNTFLQMPNTYEQGLKCEELLGYFETWKNSEKRSDLHKILSNKINEMQENIENGNVDNTPVFQTGGNAYTEEEWDKLIDYVDDVQEEIREVMEAEQEKQAENVKETEEPTPIEKSESILITAEYTECYYSSQVPEDKGYRYRTYYTEEGMYCEDLNGHVGNNWMFFWENEEQYTKVMEFLEQFPDDYNMRFACNETFWNDFLNDEIDMEGFMQFLDGTDNGIPSYTYQEGENTYIDREKMQWAKYFNRPGLFRELEERDEFGNLTGDKLYTDEKSGFSWYVDTDGTPYLTGKYADDFYTYCEKNGIDSVKKFAELTGLLQYLPDGSYAYVGNNGISLKSKDGEKLFVKTEDMSYDMLMNMFDTLPETENYLSAAYWEDIVNNAKNI